MTIRPLDRSDAADFHALRLGALLESPEAFAATYEEDVLLSSDDIAERIEEVFTEPRKVVLGAFMEGSLIGFIGCYQESMMKVRHKVVIWGTYVHPSARGRGVGEKLLTQLIRHVSLWDHVDVLHLTVVARAKSARALYIRVGFELFGVESDGIRDHEVRDTVEHMALRINRDPATAPTSPPT